MVKIKKIFSCVLFLFMVSFYAFGATGCETVNGNFGSSVDTHTGQSGFNESEKDTGNEKAETFLDVIMDGISMYPTISNGEKLRARVVDEDFEASRGDIILLDVEKYEEFNVTDTSFLIKRLIATEGDKIYCADGTVYICYAGESEYIPLTEEYAYYTNKEAYDFEEYCVGEGEIFFLGDNRNVSIDSCYKEGRSKLQDRLYKETDIYAVIEKEVEY